MTYRAKELSQRDGSPLAASNCRMTSIAVGLDFHTLGAKKSTGGKMRTYTSDQQGGTDAGDAREAWTRGYSENLVVRDGQLFDTLLRDLDQGHLVHIDVWHAAAGGPCLSGSGGYGHTMAVAPERNGSRWLTCDPWCLPAKWTWWEESKLRAGAEQWGARLRKESGGNAFLQRRGPVDDIDTLDVMHIVAKTLMTLNNPNNPEVDAEQFDLADTGGGAIMYTMTRVQTGAGGGEGMAINSAAGLATSYTCQLSEGRDFYEDPNLTKRLGEMSKAATVPYVGASVHETVAGGSVAVQVHTGTLYADKEPRPSVVYVAGNACIGGPQLVPTPPPTPELPDVDEDAIRAARDAQWREWLLAGNPGDEE